MPGFRSREIGILVDMAGCPNRCRHCWLGCPPNRRMSEKTFRWVVQQFKEWVYPGEQEPFFRPFDAMTWYREPDFAPNYRELHEIEKEVSEGRATRFELLSIWRLARDKGYAEWAHEVGAASKRFAASLNESTESCQITFFGMEKTTDYFARRRGAFLDNLIATECLLEVGVKPRWQLFLTKSIVPELDDLLCLADFMRLEKRVGDIGGEFEIFIHTPSPDGEAWNIEHLRPDVDVLSHIPEYLVEKTKAHLGVSSIEEAFGYAEDELITKFLDDPEPYAWQPKHLAFMVSSDLDVFSNVGELAPWWRLGNLRTDSIDDIMWRFENDEAPGMYAHFHVPVSTLAEEYGQRGSRRIYQDDDLKVRLVRQWAMENEGRGENGKARKRAGDAWKRQRNLMRRGFLMGNKGSIKREELYKRKG